MKSVQLDSLIEIMESGNTDLIKSFILISDVGYDFKSKRGMTYDELHNLYTLSKKIIENLSFSQKAGYILGFKIETGIREEFDVLRYSNKSILNIELKSDIPSKGLEPVRIQLLRHYFLLGVSGKEVNVFTYIERVDQLYTIDENEELIEVDTNILLDYITEEYTVDSSLKDLSLNTMIISPYTQPAEFSSRRYFLTNEQIEVRDNILKSNKRKICLSGGPGTGKTLLLVDVARKYQDQGNNVVIVFCSKMPDSEANEISRQLGIDIIPIRRIVDNNSILDSYDIILADESQRLRVDSFKMFLAIESKTVIFSVDYQQTLHPAEKRLNIEGILQNEENIDKFRLKNKIRTDKAMSSFIQKLLYLKARNIEPHDYDNVQVIYFDDEKEANRYISNMCQENNYVSIEQTEYRTKSTRVKKRKNLCFNSISTHDVLGREYENVIVLLDKHFYYNDDAYLVSNYPDYYPYLEGRQIFQSLTRVKNKLLIVVLENPKLYITIQKIINWKKERLLKDT